MNMSQQDRIDIACIDTRGGETLRQSPAGRSHAVAGASVDEVGCLIGSDQERVYRSAGRTVAMRSCEKDANVLVRNLAKKLEIRIEIAVGQGGDGHSVNLMIEAERQWVDRDHL